MKLQKLQNYRWSGEKFVKPTELVVKATGATVLNNQHKHKKC